MKKQLILLLLALGGLLVMNLPVSGQEVPSFVLFAPGFWGSIDHLPSKSPLWLAESPYPHFCKHQETPYLTGPDYQPIPQKYLALGAGPGLSKAFLRPYAKLQQELNFWAQKRNREDPARSVRIIDDWQALALPRADGETGIGNLNFIYLKYDWRLGLAAITQYYVDPLLALIDKRWPGAKIHWVGHSLGGLLGRYVVSRHPQRFTSLISIGGPQYGIYEIGRQRRGLPVDYGGEWDLAYAQEVGLRFTEKYFFGTRIVQSGKAYEASAAEFARRYMPIMHWLDPEEQRLQDGFGTLPKLAEAVPHAVAYYGLGYGSFDLQGHYHPELLEGKEVGSGLAAPPGSAYAQTGDGRVDPVSARGPFPHAVCLGKEMQHGELMWSPLVLASLVDRFFFDGRMSRSQLRLELLRRGIYWNQPVEWLIRARQSW